MTLEQQQLVEDFAAVFDAGFHVGIILGVMGGIAVAPWLFRLLEAAADRVWNWAVVRTSWGRRFLRWVRSEIRKDERRRRR